MSPERRDLIQARGVPWRTTILMRCMRAVRRTLRCTGDRDRVSFEAFIDRVDGVHQTAPAIGLLLLRLIEKVQRGLLFLTVVLQLQQHHPRHDEGISKAVESFVAPSLVSCVQLPMRAPGAALYVHRSASQPALTRKSCAIAIEIQTSGTIVIAEVPVRDRGVAA